MRFAHTMLCLSVLFFHGAQGAEGRPAFIRTPPDTAATIAANSIRFTSVTGEPVDPASGGGADVSDFEAIQTRYGDPEEGNAVTLVWTENTFNPPDTLTLFLNDDVLDVLGGRPENAVFPGLNSGRVINLEPGTHTFVLEAQDGTFGQAAIEVLDEAPITPLDLIQCETGAAVDGGCDFLLRWSDLSPIADGYITFLNGLPFARMPAGVNGIGFTQPAGAATLEVVSTHGLAGGTYGHINSVTCQVACPPVACQAPTNITIHQFRFGTPSQLEATWRNADPGLTEFAVLLDGVELGRAPANINRANVQLDPAEVVFGLQSVCADNSTSTVADRAFTVLAGSPHTNPIVGPATHTFDEIEGTVVNWTNGDPSLFFDLLVDIDGDPNNRVFLIRALPILEEFTITGTTETDVPVLQFFTLRDGMCYGSEPIVSVPEGQGKLFIRGYCDGRAQPGILTGLFLLNFLFAGGPAPPCQVACDVDADGRLGILDGLSLLNYLFASGSPPSGWIDSDGDLLPDPTCDTAPPEDDCVEAHPACPL